MNLEIKEAISNGRLILLLGAGASCTSKTITNSNVPLGNRLARILAEAAGWEYQDEPLPTVFGAVKGTLGDRVFKLLEDNYKHCTPSDEYCNLAKYPFARIYTLNIDDALETAIRKHSNQRLSIKLRNDRVVETDQFYRKLELIKLNGDICRPEDGFVFSPQEYGQATAQSPVWYEELASDFYKYSFLFIGTALQGAIVKSGVQSIKQHLDPVALV